MTNNDNVSLRLGKQYSSPETRLVTVKVQGILCESPLGEKYATETEEGDDNW